MPSTSTSYSSRAKAPFEALTPHSFPSSPQNSSSNRRSFPHVSSTRKDRRGPEFEPLTLTAYEPGKRVRPEREDSEDSRASTNSGSDRSRSEDSDSSDSDDQEPRSKPERRLPPPPPRSSNRTLLYLVFAIILVLFLGAGVYIYRSSQPTSLESTSTNPSSTVAPKTSTTQATSASSTSSMSEIDSSDSTTSSTAESVSSTTSSASTPSRTSSSSSSPSTSPESDSSSSSPPNDSAPPEYSGITLSGTFVPTSSYSVATGSAGYVGDSKANADMSKIQVEPQKELVGDEGKGKIWVGDVTFYAAGKGGYGSCGTKLYDGQDLYFAAMSVYDLMGSASPAPFCYSCISLQSTKDPSKTITAIVADSCPACTLAHVDLERKAFFALGATVEMGVLTVAWSFVDCPEGWTQKALEGVSEDVHEEVE